MMKKHQVLIIGTVWPEPHSSAAGSRMMQLIYLFQKQHWEITFASIAADSEFAFDLTIIGVTKVSIQLNHPSFDEFIKELNPNIVLFDRFMSEEQFGWRVAECCPDAVRIIDTEDLHCLRYARQQAFRENRNFQIGDLNNEIAKREIASIIRSDLSLIISSFEMKLLIEHFKVDESLLLYLPFMLNQITENDEKKWPSFDERDHFIAIGNFRHEPNWNAVAYLKQTLWPLIRKQLPNTQLHIYGAYPSQKVFELHKPNEGFLIKGRAEDAGAVIRKAKVCLAPLRFGAGLKGKLIDAMCNGTPSVATSVATEAMHQDFNWSGIIADDEIDFANAAVKLFSDKQEWESARKNCVQIINTVFCDNAKPKSLISRIKFLVENLREHRNRNFTGTMLMHHTLQSTKYMSRWIEEKNRN